jgi:spermidine synthase
MASGHWIEQGLPAIYLMDATAVSTRPHSSRFLPLLLLLFFGSGCAALIYEIVWLQLLQLVVGPSAVSLGVLLGTYMGGMCLGSLLLPRFVSATRHPLAVYAAIEVGIGIIGVVVLFAVPALGKVYAAYVGHGFVSILLRGVLGAFCLLPPTLFMGATLPAMARWVESTPQGVSWMGFFYGGNIAGAVFGCLLAGFYLLRVHDMATATFVAAGLNGIVALIGFVLAATTSKEWKPSLPIAGPARTKGGTAIYLAIALSGLTALGSEVVWTRLLSLLLGGTVYTFSIILGVFLFGLGIGSSVGSVLSRTVARPQVALGICQLLLTGAVAWASIAINRSLPYWPISLDLAQSPWFTFQLDLMRCFWAIFPATVLWGASFPLALAALVSRGQDPGKLVGKVYAANTMGAILGAVGFSVVFIPRNGTQSCQHWVILFAAVAAGLAFCSRRPTADRTAEESSSPESAPSSPGLVAKIGWGALCAVLMVFFVWSVPPLTWGLVAYGRRNVQSEHEGERLFVGEGMNSSVAVTKLHASGARNFHVSGKIEASTEPQDMRLQRMLGHLPALLHPNPKSVLIVGCGAGVTAGSFVVHPGIERIVICELEPLIPKVVARYFSEENYNVVTDQRVQIIYDDARHFILTSREKFDIITSDPIHPWVKGSATLYTQEYFELVKQHLNPGGVVTQWVPLYESTPAVVKSEAATFFTVFPHGTIWSNDEGGRGYDVVFMAQDGPSRIDVNALHDRLNRSDHADVKSSLKEVGFPSALDLMMTYAGQASDLTVWLADAEINHDRNLRLQYLAGMGANLYNSEGIFNQMIEHRRFPEGLFVATEPVLEELRKTVKPRIDGN